MRDCLPLPLLGKIQLEYENTAHRADTTFAAAITRLKPALLQESPTELLFQPGEVIFEEGQEGDVAYILRSGVAAELKGELDRPVVLGFYETGEVVGEISMIDDKPRSTTLVAIRLTRLVRIRKDIFRELLSSRPEGCACLLLTLANRQREINDEWVSARTKYLDTGSEVLNLRAEKEHLIELQHMREEMTNLVVHDLRVPLGNITNALGLLHMLLPSDIWEENREVFDIARASADRLTRLSESLLEMSRLESGEITIHWSSIDIEDLIIFACNHINLHLRSGISIKRQIALRIPQIRGDQDLLVRVLLNLLDNAIKYSPPEGTIVVSAESQRGKVIVSVSDDGPGIPLDRRERLFERFSRVETTSRGGFGLGLVYCRLAVEAHGGKIWVEDNEEGQGSKFVFRLPILEK